MSPEWWHSASLIKICNELFKRLAKWLKSRHCSNYFVPEANLFHEPLSSKVLEKIDRRLNEFGNPGILCNWLFENYILSFSRSYLKLNVTMEALPHYMFLLLDIWTAIQLKSLDFYVYIVFTCSHMISRSILKDGSNSGLSWGFKMPQLRFMNLAFKSHGSLELKTYRSLRDLPTIRNVLCLTYSDIQRYILHAAYGLGCGEISWDSSFFVGLVNAISTHPKIIKSQHHNFPKMIIERSSRFNFLRALTLLENLTGSNSCSEIQLLPLMIKQFLIKALKYDGSVSNGIAHAALTYLAALHFAASEYQEATRLCLAVLTNKTSQEYK